ncbi:phospholipase D-like domain-containing protein [Allosphingosinicella humi]
MSDPPLLEPGRNCWRVALAGRASVIVDAADYYRLAKRAMLKARQQIILVGWDFDSRIFLDRAAADDAPTKGVPNELGRFIQWLADNRPELCIHILKWDVGALKLLGRGTTLFRLARWMWHERITFKLDGAHAKGASHHQKILVIDDALAFCGGIDMTADRWDTRAHRHHHPGRRRPTTRRRYGPWHDATMAVDGDAARALGELARERWAATGGGELPTPEAGQDPWPPTLKPQFKDVSIAIARTRGEYEDLSEIRENERLFVDLIRSATSFIYAENQYFASRVVAEAIAERLKEPDGPEFVLVNPDTANGWLEEEVMGAARAELMKSLARVDAHGRFRVYTPVNEAGDAIYVHAKIMIVDDRVLRVGSSNMNNRSMGLDSECDVAIDAGYPGNGGAIPAIEAIRVELIAEHLGTEPDEVRRAQSEAGSLIRAIERLGGTGRSLRPFTPPEPNPLERKIARSETLDPEHAEELFEPITRRKLLRGLPKPRRARPAG